MKIIFCNSEISLFTLINDSINEYANENECFMKGFSNYRHAEESGANFLF
jgi:hypothetical protein